jgi:class 3 adenylate cyclase
MPSVHALIGPSLLPTANERIISNAGPGTPLEVTDAVMPQLTAEVSGLPGNGLTQFWTDQVNDPRWQLRFESIFGKRPESGLPVTRIPRAIFSDIAILSVDIEDSTDFYSRLEAQGKSVSEALKAIFRPLEERLIQCGGLFVRQTQDSISGLFVGQHAVWHAINAALELQESWRRPTLEGISELNVRAGLGFGNAEVSLDTVTPHAIGSAVNKAFHASSGKRTCRMLDNNVPGFSIFLHESFESRVDWDGLMLKAAEQK